MQNRKFEMPEWAKTGPVSLKNFTWRVWQHCAEHSTKRGGSHPTIGMETPEYPLWLQYFYHHLGGLPLCARMVIEQKTQTFTAPEQVPQWFDPSFEPDPTWRAPEYQSETRAGFRPIERANVFVPSGSDLYDEMCQRAQHADSLDWRMDSTRRGIWVPLRWMPEHDGERGRHKFRQLTGSELRKLYGQPGVPPPYEELADQGSAA